MVKNKTSDEVSRARILGPKCEKYGFSKIGALKQLKQKRKLKQQQNKFDPRLWASGTVLYEESGQFCQICPHMPLEL